MKLMDDRRQPVRAVRACALTSGKEGLGLGLNIAAEIARAHKGALEFRSDPAETCFTLKLPIGA